LPFDNLSGETASAYFADGIQEEILTRLSKIRDLKNNFADIDATLQKRVSQSDLLQQFLASWFPD